MKRKRRPKKPPWYHQLSPVTWLLLWLLLAASASLAIRTTWNATHTSRAPQVQVLNGCGVPDLARSVAEELRERGLDVVSVGNADSKQYRSTLVLLRRGDMSVARRVAARLGQGTTLEQQDPTLLVDVTVILGHDYVEQLRASSRSGLSSP